MAPPRMDPDPAEWGKTDLRNLEFRGVAARRIAIAGKDHRLLRTWLLRLSDDVALMVERLRDYGDV